MSLSLYSAEVKLRVIQRKAFATAQVYLAGVAHEARSHTAAVQRTALRAVSGLVKPLEVMVFRRAVSRVGPLACSVWLLIGGQLGQ